MEEFLKLPHNGSRLFEIADNMIVINSFSNHLACKNSYDVRDEITIFIYYQMMDKAIKDNEKLTYRINMANQ